MPLVSEILDRGRAYIERHHDDKASVTSEEMVMLLGASATVRQLNESHCDERYPYLTKVEFQGVVFVTVTRQKLSY